MLDIALGFRSFQGEDLKIRSAVFGWPDVSADADAVRDLTASEALRQYLFAVSMRVISLRLVLGAGDMPAPFRTSPIALPAAQCRDSMVESVCIWRD